MKKQQHNTKLGWIIVLVLVIFSMILVTVHQIYFNKSEPPQPRYNHRIESLPKDITIKINDHTEHIMPLFKVVLGHPNTLNHLIKLSKESILIFNFSPSFQDAMALKYLSFIKDIRILNTKYIQAFNHVIHDFDARYGTKKSVGSSRADPYDLNTLTTFQQGLNILESPDALAPYLDKHITPERAPYHHFIFNLLKDRRRAYEATAKMLAEFDRDFEALHGEFMLAKHNKKGTLLWQRTMDRIKSFFYYAMPISGDTMDIEMIDKANNDF